MTASAVYGFIGVLLGSATTALLTVYRERLLSTREREARKQQRQQDLEDQRNIFQRQSLLALQDAVSDLLKALFNEQDRMLEEMQRTGEWPARHWETPTAIGWEDADLRLQVFRARVFDEKLRDLAHKIHEAAEDSVWASSPDKAKVLARASRRNTNVSMIWLPTGSRNSTESGERTRASHTLEVRRLNDNELHR